MSAPLLPQPMHRTDVEQIGWANATGRTPVLFIHGLWLLPSSWDRWGPVFVAAGYASLCPGWPGDRDRVVEDDAEPMVLANKTVGEVADHYAAIIGKLDRKPVVIGHSFGGLLTQILAGQGLAAASVAIDAAPFRGALPLPLPALRSAAPVLGDPANRHRAVPLTFEQFRYAFANTVAAGEAEHLFETFVVPASGAPTFQAAAANRNPRMEARVNSVNADRGPMLIVSGGQDHIVPMAVSGAIYGRQQRNPGVTEFVEMPDRGHSLTIDAGWREVANTALAFVKRFA